MYAYSVFLKNHKDVHNNIRVTVKSASQQANYDNMVVS